MKGSRPAIPVAPESPTIHLGDRSLQTTIAIRPAPLKASVGHLRVGPHVVTSIYREWPRGATGPSGTCRRCPICTASGHSCHLVVRRYVPREEAALFALVSLPSVVRQDL